MKIGQSAGKSYAYLLGVYLGDGCVTRHKPRDVAYPVFRLNTIDEDFAAATKAALSELSDYSVWVGKHAVKRGRDNFALQCMDGDLCRRLVEDTHSKTIIPQRIIEGTRDERIAFVAGLMDSEGFVAKLKKPKTTNRSYYMGFKSCDVWIPQFLQLLDGLGVRYGKVSQEVPRKDGYKTPTRFTIKMQSWIDAGCYFNIRRKQERVDEWASAPAYTQRSLYPRRLASETERQIAA